MSRHDRHSHASAAGIQSSAWGQKVAAAASISAICEAQAPTLGPHAEAIVKLLLSELPGRIWAGKEAVLEAIGALAAAFPAAVDCEVRATAPWRLWDHSPEAARGAHAGSALPGVLPAAVEQAASSCCFRVDLPA